MATKQELEQLSLDELKQMAYKKSANSPFSTPEQQKRDAINIVMALYPTLQVVPKDVGVDTPVL